MTLLDFEEMVKKRFNLEDLPCTYKDDKTAAYDWEYKGMQLSLYHVQKGSSTIPSPQETGETFVRSMLELQSKHGTRIAIYWDSVAKAISREEWTPFLWGDTPVLLPLDTTLHGNYGEEGLFPALHEAVMVAFNAHHPDAWRKLTAIHAKIGENGTHYSEVAPLMLSLHDEVGDVKLCLLQESGQLFRVALLNLEAKAGIKITIEHGHIQVSEARARRGKRILELADPPKEHPLVPGKLRTIRQWRLSSPEELAIDFIIDSTDEEEGVGKEYHLDIRLTIKILGEQLERLEQIIKEKEEQGEEPYALYGARNRIANEREIFDRFWPSDIFLNPWVNGNWELQFLNGARFSASWVAEFFGARSERPEESLFRNVLML